MDIIVIAALAEEADALFAGQGSPTEPGWPAVRHVAFAGHSIRIATSGIGKVNVATVAATLHQQRPSDLLAITGTAGKIGKIDDDCFYLARAVQSDYGAERPGNFVHYTPGAWPIGPASVDHYIALPDPGTGLRAATIASADAFIECPDHSALLVERLGADLVDMETGALAQFAALADVPWVGIKATTDDANQESAGDFHANLVNASKRAAAAMERLIGRL